MSMKNEYLRKKKVATLGWFGTLVMNTHGAVWCMYLMLDYKIALVPSFLCPCWQHASGTQSKNQARNPPPLWENMVCLDDAYKEMQETTAWELPDDMPQVPPSMEPTQVEQPLPFPVLPPLQEMETVLPSHEGEAEGHKGENLIHDTPDKNLSPMPQM
eukprot:9797432-Ditylum_brightwellii.AAC.1